MRLHRASRQRVHQPGQSHRSDAGASSVHSAVFGQGCRSRRKPHRHLLQRTDGAGSTTVQQQQIEGAGDRDLHLKLHPQQGGWRSRVLVWSRAGPGTWRTTASSGGEVPTHHCHCLLWVTLLTVSPVRSFYFRPPWQENKKNLLFSLSVGPQLGCPTKLQVREGERLSCEVRGNPRPLVTWVRDGQVVALPMSSSREHAGKYTVLAISHLERKNFTVEVEVLGGGGRFHSSLSCNKTKKNQHQAWDLRTILIICCFLSSNYKCWNSSSFLNVCYLKISHDQKGIGVKMETESKVQSRPLDFPLSLSRTCKQL